MQSLPFCLLSKDSTSVKTVQISDYLAGASGIQSALGKHRAPKALHRNYREPNEFCDNELSDKVGG
jgi:hypothetical protein